MSERMWSPTTPERDELYGRIVADAMRGDGHSFDEPDRATKIGFFISWALIGLLIICKANGW